MMLLHKLCVELVRICIVKIDQSRFGRTLNNLTQTTARGLQYHVFRAVPLLRKYDAGQALTVPSFLAMLVAYPMFLNGWSFPPQIESAIELLGRMSTPLCMVIMGMRLATVSVKELVTDWRSLLASLIKLIAFPLAMLGVMLMLPVEPFVRAAMFLVACCPSATVMLSLCEIINHGQKSAANTVLISTLLSVITIPLMILLFYPM